MIEILAQQPSQPIDDYTGWLLAVLGLLVLIVVATVIVVAVKRRIQKDDNQGPAFDLDQLEKMYRDGLISKEEFTRMRNMILR